VSSSPVDPRPGSDVPADPPPVAHATSTADGASRTFWLVLGGILVAALALRVAVFAACRDWILFRVPVLDAGFYHETAQGLLDGTWPGSEPFFMGPLYSYLLAGLYALLGAEVVVARGFQMALGLGTVALTGIAGRRAFGSGAGLAAASLVALHGPLLFYEQIPLMTTALVFGTALLLERTLAIRARPSMARVASAGIVLGALVALRGTAILFLPAMVLVTGIAPWRGRNAVLALASAAVVVAPFTIHNLRAGSPALTTTSLGWNLFIGNHAGATGMFAYPNGWRAESDVTGRGFASEQAGRALDADETHRYWLGRALDDVRNAPARWMGLELRKLGLVLQAAEIPQNESVRFFQLQVPVARVAVSGWWLLLPLFVAGVLVAGGRRGELLRIATFAVVPLVTCVAFFVTARYRLPMVPVLAIGGGLALVRLVAAVRAPSGSRPATSGERPARVTATILGTVVPLSLVLLLLPAPYDTTRALARDHEHVGLRYQREGAFRAAEAEYREALALHPADGDAWNNLGSVLEELGRPGEAVDAYQYAARHQPGNPVPWMNLGRLHGRAERHADAEAAFAAAVRVDPARVGGWIDLGTARARQGNLLGAMDAYRQALRLDPGHQRAEAMLTTAHELAETLGLLDGAPDGDGGDPP